LKAECGPILAPPDCGDNECLETYIETCAYITALFSLLAEILIFGLVPVFMALLKVCRWQ